MTKYVVSPLVGLKAYAAMNSFQRLMLGFKMIPMYLHLTYEEFFPMILEKNDCDRETLIRQAAILVPLSADDIEILIHFCKDKNGVPFGSSNIKAMDPSQIHEMVIAVCLELLKIKISLVSDEEKKNYPASVSTSEVSSQKIQ